MITRLAVKWLIRQLRKDKQLWYSYQSNIAMIIFDNMDKYMPLRNENLKDATPDPLNKDYLPTRHEFCIICANDFLNLWTKDIKQPLPRASAGVMNTHINEQIRFDSVYGK